MNKKLFPVRLAHVLNLIAQDCLGKLKFKRKVNVFNRKRDSFIDVIEFQLGKGSSPGFEQFTINAGVFNEKVHELIWGKKAGAQINEVDCLVRARIGELIDDNFSGKAFDKWWTLNKDDENVTSEVVELINKLIDPFLRRYDSFQKIEQFLLDRKTWLSNFPLSRIQLAVVQNELGKEEICLQQLQCITNGKNDAWAERAKKVVKAIGQKGSKGDQISY